MPLVRYFAAAEERAGRAEEPRSERTLGDLLAGLADSHPSLGEILPRCAVLVGGARRSDDAVLDDDVLVDVLPPFAGG